MGERDAHIHIRVTEDRKQRWRNEIEASSEYRDLTHLITTAVKHELFGNDDEPAAVAGEVTVDMEETQTQLDSIHDELRDLRNTVDKVHDIVKPHDQTKEVLDFVMEKIPVVNSEQEITQKNRENYADADPLVGARELGLESAILEILEDRLKVREQTAHQILDRLNNEIDQVEMVELGPDDKRYYRIEPDQ